MNSNQKLSYAIAAILSGSAAGFTHAATATDTETSDSIQEITVTAQRRTENVQNVPINARTEPVAYTYVSSTSDRPADAG